MGILVEKKINAIIINKIIKKKIIEKKKFEKENLITNNLIMDKKRKTSTSCFNLGYYLKCCFLWMCRQEDSTKYEKLSSNPNTNNSDIGEILSLIDDASSPDESPFDQFDDTYNYDS